MTDLDEIKRRVDIVDLISQYVTLKKAGANYKAPCPFHKEKTPSFMVSPEKQIFKCFGCGEAGDVFGFVMKMEGLEFVEALNLLADRAGIVISKSISKEEYKKEKDTKSRLYKINLLSAQVFHKILMETKAGEEARKYLEKRGLKNKTINDFMLGYAPEKPILRDFLLKRGFGFDEIKAAGGPDRFYKRIMFPIMDVMGNVVGFTGRILDPKLEPKYLNTPESPIYHKSRIVYGLDRAKAEIKLNKECIIVEGQMDVVMSYQAGVENAVAVSGTALTPEHLYILGRYISNIVFAFDSDSAGREAQKKAIKMAIEAGQNAKIIVLPKDIKDPGEAAEKDPKLWQEISAKNIPALDWIFAEAFKSRDAADSDFKELTGAEKKEIAKEILPFIKIIPDEIEKNHYLKMLAKKLQVSERTIIEALAKTKTVKTKTADNNKSSRPLTIEENLIGLLMIHPEFIKLVATDLDYQEFDDKEFSQPVYKALQSCYTKDSCKQEFNLEKECGNILKSEHGENLENKIKFLVLEIEKNADGANKDEIKKEILDSASRIKNRKKENTKEEFARRIQNAEASGKREDVKKLLEELQREIGKK